MAFTFGSVEDVTSLYTTNLTAALDRRDESEDSIQMALKDASQYLGGFGNELI